MATPLTQALDDCRKEEGILSSLVNEDVVKFQQIEQILTRHRALCSDALLSDFQTATAPGFRAEDRLWDNHQKVNSRFRSALLSVRNSQGQKAVELRKLGHEYLKFIKNSQSFYRNFIKRLNQTYGGIPSLERVAKKLNSDLRANNALPLGHPTSTQLELCCHRTLIHLGDLSRYRETELSGAEKNWAPAYGYYDLARTVCPDSGVPFNQRAVIALADKALFRAIYYVYRSLSAEDPHPQGDMNIRRALHKVQQAWNSKELVNENQATTGAALPKGMIAWYLRLLEMFYHGKATPDKDALENEVMSQLQVDMGKNPSADPPHKLVITTIAAQHAAQERFENKQSPSHQNSYLLFLELNVRIFTALLRVFVEELKSNVDKADHTERQQPSNTNLLTPTLRRALPALRMYDLWLHKTCEIIDSPASGLKEELKSEFWALYAETLTSMTTTFPPQDLPDIQHLLEEDEDTIGFRPLLSDNSRAVWYQNEQLKPSWHEMTDEADRDATQEMLYRVREFMVRGLELVVTNASKPYDKVRGGILTTSSQRVPVDFEQSQCRFTYQHASSLGPIQAAVAPQVNEKSSTKPDAIAIQQTADDTQDEDAERMVDDIVGKSMDAPAVPKSGLDLSAQSPFPATPPHTAINRSSYGTASPFPMGTHTVNDIMAMTYKQPKSTSPGAQAQHMQQSRSSSRPSSQLQSPAMPQPLLRAASETSVGSAQNQSSSRIQYYPEDPQLPGLGVVSASAVQGVLPKLSSPPAGRPSPLPPPLSHSRVNSSDSARGIWGGGLFTPSYHPTDARRASGGMSPSHLGNGSMGVGSGGQNRVPNSFPEPGRDSPIFQNGANTPWNHSLRESNQALDAESFNSAAVNSEPQAAKLSWSSVAGRNSTAWQPT